jgi:hypothetical protein
MITLSNISDVCQILGAVILCGELGVKFVQNNKKKLICKYEKNHIFLTSILGKSYILNPVFLL